jgi:hypothetical protein
MVAQLMWYVLVVNFFIRLLSLHLAGVVSQEY